MIIPIRCFTCGKCISNIWPKYIEELEKLNEQDKSNNSKSNDSKSNECKLLDKYKVKRYCCRRMMISCVDLVDKI